MKLYAGIDVGSAASKAILIDERFQIMGRGLSQSGADFSAAAGTVYREALLQAGASAEDVVAVVATGYGRANVEFASQRRTEIDCHARGAYHFFPQAITVVDIGGQDNKVIRVDDQGKRISFSMNRKCAAGTGAFLEEIALRLRIPLETFSELAQKSRDPSVQIGSYCTVFAMTEILSKIRQGVRPEDLARAALESVARRILEAEAITGNVVATGGVVAYQPRMKDILERILKTEVRIPPFPQFTGALGAALIAAPTP